MHPTEVKVLDINALHHGVPEGQLMENAGREVAEAAGKHFDFSHCVVVCGSGNNGGDGLVAALGRSPGNLNLAGSACVHRHRRTADEIPIAVA